MIARSLARCFVLLSGWLLLVVATAQGGLAEESAGPEETGVISGRVLDGQGKPAAGADVELYQYEDRRWTRRESAVRTNDAGEYRFEGLPEGYFVVVTKTPGSARTFRQRSLEQGGKVASDIVLRPPVAAVLEIRDQAGRPVAGARIRELEWRGENGEFWVRSNAWELFEMTAPVSDESGRLHLPPLPEGVIVKAVLEHRDFAPAEISELEIEEGARGKIEMRAGAPFRFQIHPDVLGDRVSGVEIDLRYDPHKHPSTILFHVVRLDEQGAARLTVEPGKYRYLRLEHDDYYITPIISPNLRKGESLRITADQENRFDFKLHRKVRARGRVVDVSTGKPLAGVDVLGEIPNEAPNPVEDVPLDPWCFTDWGETDENGEYEMLLAGGRARVSFQSQNYLTESDYLEFTVASDGSTVIPDIKVRPMPPIRGVVLDESGEPVPGAVVRLRGFWLRWLQPVLTDDEGRFELQPPWIPLDSETDERRPIQPVFAFHPYERLSARVDVPLDDPESLSDVVIRLRPEPCRALFTEFTDEMSKWEQGKVSPERAAEDAAKSLRGKPAPELDGVLWLNTEEPMLKLSDLRGKYVLLDFWFKGCGPCHADFPSVQLLHDLYKDRGVVVIGVHNNSETAEAVRDHVEKEGLTFPIVVDHPDGRTVAKYEAHGISGYPSYILIGPDGNVLLDDETVPHPALRTYKLEIVRNYLIGNE